MRQVIWLLVNNIQVTIAVVTLQAFTRGKSFYLGKISLGKFTSGFIFPRLKGHTGDHWTLGGLTSQRIKFKVFILIPLLFITLFQRARRARVILLQRLISQRIQRRRRAAFCQFLTIFAWRQHWQRPKRVAWVLPRPQYWFETLFHSNALNMWWKENFQVSRETFNFICATVGPRPVLLQRIRSVSETKFVFN